MSAKILIISDGKAGHVNQSRALCDSLGYPYDIAEVKYVGRLRKGCSYLLDRVGVLHRGLFEMLLPPGDYKAVVGTGSTSFYPAKVIARQLKIPVVAILTPRGYRMDFDCILAPTFDRLPLRDNVVQIPVNLTNTSAGFYAKGVADFKAKHTPRKAAAGLIIGGPNDFATMRTTEMERQLQLFFEATEGCERWVTTSRRTPQEVDTLLEAMPFDYRLIYRKDQFNPIPAFVMLCETLFVTADSTGMISEAVTSGNAAVEILMNLENRDSKFGRLIDGLAAINAVHIFDGKTGKANHKIDLKPAIREVANLLRLTVK